MTGGIDGGGKPHFEKHDQIFISTTEITTCQPHVLAAVREHAGNNYIIVTGDGLEVKDSSGTEGMYYKLLINEALFFVIISSRNQILEGERKEILCNT